MNKLPIVILHGWNLNSENYSPLVKEFKKNEYQVYCFNLPGFGKSDIPKKPLYLSDYVDFVINYFKDHKIEKPIIIGHSFGGRVAIKLSATNPEILKALVLTGTPAYLPVPRYKALFFLFLAKAGNLIFSLPLLSSLKDYARSLLYKTARATDFYNTHKAMRETFKNIVREDLVPYLSQIKTPTLLLWGQDDQITPLSIATKANKVIRNSKLIVISGAKHGAPWTNSVRFAESVSSFLNNLS